MQLGYGWKGLGIMGLIILGILLYGLSLEGELRMMTLDSFVQFLKLWLLLLVALLISTLYKFIRRYLHKKGLLDYQPIEVEHQGSSISVRRIIKWLFIIIGVPIFILIMYAIFGDV